MEAFMFIAYLFAMHYQEPEQEVEACYTTPDALNTTTTEILYPADMIFNQGAQYTGVEDIIICCVTSSTIIIPFTALLFYGFMDILNSPQTFKTLCEENFIFRY